MHIYPTFRKSQFVSTTIHSKGRQPAAAMPDPTQDLWSVANANIPCASSNDQVTNQHFCHQPTTNLATRLKPKNWGIETCKKSIASCDFLAKKKQGGSIINPCLDISVLGFLRPYYKRFVNKERWFFAWLMLPRFGGTDLLFQKIRISELLGCKPNSGFNDTSSIHFPWTSSPPKKNMVAFKVKLDRT